VARAGSFRGASEILRIAPSAVHRQITLLEQTLGTRLFDRQRGRQGVRLTAAGEVLKLRIGQAVEMLARAAVEITALEDVQRGRVSIGVNDTLATDVLAGFISSYSASAPRLDFEVRVDESPALVDAVVEGGLDAVLCFGPPTRAGLRTLWKQRLPTVVVVRPDHPLAEKTEVTLGECAQFPLAMQKGSDWTRGFADRAFRQAGFRPRMLLQSNSFGMMRELVLAGLAISIQTYLPGIDSGSAAGLKFVPIKAPIDDFSLLVCRVPSERRLPPATHSFVEALVAFLKDGIEREQLGIR